MSRYVDDPTEYPLYKRVWWHVAIWIACRVDNRWLPYEVKLAMTTPVTWYPIKRIYWDARFKFRRLYCRHPEMSIAHGQSGGADDFTTNQRTVHCDHCTTRWTQSSTGCYVKIENHPNASITRKKVRITEWSPKLMTRETYTCKDSWR